MLKKIMICVFTVMLLVVSPMQAYAATTWDCPAIQEVAPTEEIPLNMNFSITTKDLYVATALSLIDHANENGIILKSKSLSNFADSNQLTAREKELIGILHYNGAVMMSEDGRGNFNSYANRGLAAFVFAKLDKVFYMDKVRSSYVLPDKRNKNIVFAYERGLMNLKKGYFRPNDTFKRVDLWIVLNRIKDNNNIGFNLENIKAGFSEVFKIVFEDKYQNYTLYVGQNNEVTIKGAYNRYFEYRIIDQNIAYITGTNWNNNNLWAANLIGLSPGTTTLEVYENGRLYTTLKVIVTNTNTNTNTDYISLYDLSMEAGESKDLQYDIYPKNSSAKLTWKSSDTSIVTVNQNGKVIAHKAGTSVITVTASNGVYATCLVSVFSNTYLSLSDTSAEISLGNTYNLYAYTNANNVYWYSQDSSIASVTQNGVVKANKVGTTIITAKLDNGTKAICVVNITNNVKSIRITSEFSSMNVREVKKITIATVPPTSEYDKNISWISDNPQVLSVDADGYVYANAEGYAKITVTLNGISDSKLIRVNK